ncbi:MAG: FxsA family protein [Plesiomonas sp.]|uniref:FxsA family protein n=1 Tax=Plesiomonas sp. TaxID=2486279 RepID=UPI003F389359
MRLFFLFLFLFLPFIEITLFIQVADQIGGWATLALALLTSVLGISLIRSKGVQTLQHVQRKLAQGEMPAQELLQGCLLVISGILLIIPGFFTDFVALILLLPWVQKGIGLLLLSRIQVFSAAANRTQGFNPFGFGTQSNDHRTFEGEFESADKPAKTTASATIEIEHRVLTSETLPQDDEIKNRVDQANTQSHVHSDSPDSESTNTKGPQNH